VKVHSRVLQILFCTRGDFGAAAPTLWAVAVIAVGRR
jgi:hypothetical protein